ncbi:hypothetical protein ACLQ25_23480 [Micromonospora sp. DT44]|uniref:hypothetical protein n=1 Tax=Micromonospora sp. DT44 TaxID=3393439 RepID=UPI003CE87662
MDALHASTAQGVQTTDNLPLDPPVYSDSVAFHEKVSTDISRLLGRAFNSDYKAPLGRRQIATQSIVKFAYHPIQLDVVEHCISIWVEDVEHVAAPDGQSASKAKERVTSIVGECRKARVQLILDEKR